MSVDIQQAGSDGSAMRVADRLRTVHVSTRRDLDVSRHLFRGEAAYVLSDPLTLQNHRLTPRDYYIFVAIDNDRPLGDIFEELVARAILAEADEDGFYRFILMLHRLNFLNLPISDEKLLYQRYTVRKRAARRAKLMGFLFLRVPVFNPDAFLCRTIRYGRHLFSPWFFAAWCLLIAAAMGVAWRRFDELAAPIQGVLVAGNLPLLWITLVVLKVMHEFGHAYACKHFGGYVPEMGVYLIVFTPCAYVDATASWGFTRRRDRLIVCLAGMYVELAVAAIALLLWSTTPAGLAHDLAYNTVILAGVVTVLFNVNPLMRFDGYYAASDLAESPNLRQQSIQCVLALLKRIFLGIRSTRLPGGRRFRLFLLAFGIAATVYRIGIVLGISAMIASKFFLIGFGLAAFFIGSTLLTTGRGLFRYLWFAEETAPVRARAIATSALVVIATPAVLFLLPMHSHVQTAAVMGNAEEHVVRAGVEGFLVASRAPLGRWVGPDDVLFEMTNDEIDEAVAENAANVQVSAIRKRVFETNDPVRAAQEEDRGAALRERLRQQRERQEDLTLRAGASGRVVHGLRVEDIGRFIHEGEPVALLAGGVWQARVLLTQEEMAAIQPKLGETVELQSRAHVGVVHNGLITRIAPAGSNQPSLASLTQLGGGAIAVDPRTGHASEPYFEVTIDLPDASDEAFRYGMTGHVRFRAGPETLAMAVARRLIRFTDKLMQG
ncbi:MAG: hypothetical protein JXA69_12315 [Phycisphaerae bacterium]|nr:hypothetical protein [Phycisphaerae bacterium]